MVMTFLFVDLFDTIGTVIAVSLKADMVDKEGRIAGVGRLLMTDAIATTAGAMRRRACRSYHYDCSQSDQIIEKMSIQQPVLLKKSFQELTVNELYELLRVRSEVFVVEEYAKGFYESVGFRQSSDTFMLDGIPHIKMTWNN